MRKQPRSIREWRRTRPRDCPLSARQFQAAALLAVGYTRVEIAELLGVRATTVRTHVMDGCRKLDVHTSAALAAQVAVRWMHTPRSGTQHYLDEFERRLGVVRARRRLRIKADLRNPSFPELDDLIKLTLDGPNEGEHV